MSIRYSPKNTNDLPEAVVNRGSSRLKQFRVSDDPYKRERERMESAWDNLHVALDRIFKYCPNEEIIKRQVAKHLEVCHERHFRV